MFIGNNKQKSDWTETLTFKRTNDLKCDSQTN